MLNFQHNSLNFNTNAMSEKLKCVTIIIFEIFPISDSYFVIMSGYVNTDICTSVSVNCKIQKDKEHEIYTLN